MVCRKLSHFNSQVLILDFTWNSYKLQEAKKFQGTQENFKWVTRETMCKVSFFTIICDIYFVFIKTKKYEIYL